MNISNEIPYENEFWQQGSFLRRADGQVLLWQGPWASNERQNMATGLPENPVFSVSYMDFFSGDANRVQASRQLRRLPLHSLLESAFFGVKSAGQTWRQADFQSPENEKFALGFAAIMQKIHRGEIDKAVPMATARALRTADEKSKVEWSKRVLQTPSQLHAFGFWDRHNGIIGATPEVLFSRNGREVQTMALAGTRLKELSSTGHYLGLSTSAQQDFLKDPKEAREHRLVAEDIQEQLSKLGQVEVGATSVLELPTLYHLHTPILLKTRVDIPLPEIDELLLKALHPTPALGVSPRKYGFQFMQELPYQNERRWFGAPMLWQISQDESLCLVLIRSIQWNETSTWVSAGCGVVKESKLENEWNEVQKKIASVFKVLGIESI